MSITSITRGIDGNLGQRLAPKNLLMHARKARITRKYNRLTNRLGLEVKPDLIFDEFGNDLTLGAFDMVGAKIAINTETINPIKSMLKRLQVLICYGREAASQYSFNGVLKHELTHFDQYSTMARSEKYGIDYVNSSVKQLYKEQVASFKHYLDMMLKERDTLIAERKTLTNKRDLKLIDKEIKLSAKFIAIQSKTIKATTEAIENPNKFNRKLYQEVVDNSGEITADSALSDEVERLVSASKNTLRSEIKNNYRTLFQKEINLSEREIDDLQYDDYVDDLLEVQARQASSIPAKILKDLLLINKKTN